MNKDADWKVLAMYFAGECSEKESAEVRRWAAEDEDHEALLAELRQVWQRTGRPPPAWDADAIWTQLHTRLRQKRQQKKAQAGSRRSPADRAPASRRRPRVSRQLVRAAAAIFVAAAVAVLIVQVQEDAVFDVFSPDVDVKVFATPKGQRMTLRLADGTRVRLNADSRLTLSPDFTEAEGGLREVRLQGEAYFDVAKNAHRPFVVHASTTVVRVLGTEFDVSAYPEAEGVQVVVAEGKVAFHRSSSTSPSPSRAGEHQAQGAVLSARQLGRLLRNGKQVVRERVDLTRYLAWMEGRLVFEEASFDEVAVRLERWYGLRVMRAASATAPGHLNATFTNEQPLSEILYVIATTFGLHYERDGNTVTFLPG